MKKLEELLNSTPEEIEFDRVMQIIEENYNYTPTRFTNGHGDMQVINEARCNEGSCKIFAFAQLNKLNDAQTLACFGRFYRNDVLENPQGKDHGNIRNFMQHGWAGVQFDQPALTEK